jgi:hypothetical protein
MNVFPTFPLTGNLKVLKLLKLLVVSNIQCNVFKIRYEGSKYIKKTGLLVSGYEQVFGLRNLSFRSGFAENSSVGY